MATADQSLVHPRLIDTDRAPTLPLAAPRVAAPIDITIIGDFDAIEPEWRRFEQYADCTAFQCFDWLSTWQRHIGAPANVVPALVIGRDRAGEIVMLVPLAVQRSSTFASLTFLGRALCDYNAPLLAPDFEQVYGRNFPEIWRRICAQLQAAPRYRHDLVLLDKLPSHLGAQTNPFTQLGVTLNPSGAYRATLTGDWETFYSEKRSSGNRRRDRNKRRRMADSGAIELVSASSPEDASQTLEILIDQKRKSFARMGVPDLFSRPGYLDFFRDLARRPSDARLVHISRLVVGSLPAATNLGIEFRGVYYHVLTSYDDGPLSRFGPGTIHLHELLRRAIERGDTTFDFTIGDEPYKRDWSDSTVTLYDLVAGATLRGHAFAAGMIASRRAKRWIKHSRFWPALTRLRSRLAGSKAETPPARQDD